MKGKFGLFASQCAGGCTGCGGWPEVETGLAGALGGLVGERGVQFN